MQFFFLQYVDPATYQILGNLKIVSTGLLLRLALRRYLSRLQWLALLLLMAGAATSQINTDCSQGVVGSMLNAPFMVRRAVWLSLWPLLAAVELLSSCCRGVRSGPAPPAAC